ncbi:DUF1931 domain-containing protein [Candidatus Woesearchaeota archaeon]|nr:MAG: DUF1931 domain-containing protein [Candidatus Woesearchaeota archaeon]
MADLVIVRSKLKEHLDGMNVGGDLADALNEEVVRLLKKAAERARANKRSTVQARDL